MTDFSEDVVPVSDMGLGQNIFRIVLIFPVSFCVLLLSPWLYRREMNYRKLLNASKKEIKQIFEK